MTSALIIREPTEAEIPALARLHVETWNATYPGVQSPPTVELRERQWREAFKVMDGSWFCFVVEVDGRLIGFAKGQRYGHADLAGFSGQLSKLYLLPQYHGQGLGRGLVGHVARRFLKQGITSMVVFSEPNNPHAAFYAAMGGERLLSPTGEFGGAYGWRDLRELAAACPVD